MAVAELIAAALETKEPAIPWVIFDQNLVKVVLKEHQLPRELERYMPEDRPNQILDVVEEFLEVHPSSWTLVQHTNHTITKLARAGNAILVGRGAHLVTAGLPHVLHVRLVAPREFRIRHIEKSMGIDYKKAAEYMLKGDRAKSRYLQMNFESKTSQDPLNFHLTINTGRVSFAGAAEIISDAVTNMRMQTPAERR